MTTFYKVQSSSTSLSLTSFNSLASGSSWASAVVSCLDSSSRLYQDISINVIAKTASGTIGSTNPQLSLFIAPINQDGSTYTDGVTAGPSTYTPVTSPNSPLLGVLNVGASATTESGSFSVRQALGWVALPPSFILWITNSTGLALASSGNTIYWAGVSGLVGQP